MRAPVSVVIPTLNAETCLSACLDALMEGVSADLIRELIVSDGGSQDATVAVAEGWGAQVVQGAASRGGQLRRGCDRARGEWLLVVHADTRLSPGWSGVVEAHMKEQRAAAFSLAFDSGGLPARLVAGWANMRSRAGLPYGDQALLLPRTLYTAAGGYPDYPLMEDVALVRRLDQKPRLLPHPAITSAVKYREQGWLQRGGRNLATLMRYFAGTDPETLARSYRGGK